MSTSASIGNFYVDYEGKERPIVYRACDLVNRPAPEGYHWEMDIRVWRAEHALFLRRSGLATASHRGIHIDEYSMPWPPEVDRYICVRDGETQ